MNYASFGKRFLALIIDGFALNIIGTFFIFTWGFFSYFALSGVISILYFTLFEGSEWHATLGKKALNIAVVDRNGNGVNYGQAFLRTLGKLLSGFILGIGYLMAAFSDACQALHDKIADSYVVEANDSYVSKPSPAPMQRGRAVLVGISGEFAGKSFPIPQNGIMLGRDNVACQIIFSNNAQGVSRHHCMVQFNPQTNMFVVNDMGSSYGTYSSMGTKIMSGQPLALKPGERFYLGTQINMFEVRL